MSAVVLRFPRPAHVVTRERAMAERSAELHEHCGLYELAAKTWLRVAELRREESRVLELRLSASLRREQMRKTWRNVGKRLRAK